MPPGATGTHRLLYFNKDIYRTDLSNYWPYFENAPEGAKVGEYTPNYYIFPFALDRIHHHFPDIKLIISLRNPVERTISQFKFYVYNMKKENNLSLPIAIEADYENYITKGLYSQHLKKIFSLFPRENVLIILYDTIKSNPQGVVKGLYEHLNINSQFISPSTSEKFNTTRKEEQIPPKFLLYLNKMKRKTNSPYRKSQIRMIKRYFNKVHRYLSYIGLSLSPGLELEIDDREKNLVYKKYFESDISELEQLIGLDLAHWKIYQ